MNSLLIALGIVVAILLVHYSYVDFRFRHLEGVLWFWLANPAPVLLWISRIAVAAAVLLALATYFIGASKLVAAVLIALMTVHIGVLIYMEIRYGR
ncbi:MAG TPA: hypothetical protein VM308_00260 [Sphingomicrobium sp.]|nr:hypothetical protein [Sphingomicrobium sp.]